jgi:hypothetical protein
MMHSTAGRAVARGGPHPHYDKARLAKAAIRLINRDECRAGRLNSRLRMSRSADAGAQGAAGRDGTWPGHGALLVSVGQGEAAQGRAECVS